MAHQESNKNTSFRKFEYCSLCKVNHNKRKKHVYSKHHQRILKNILIKFSIKILSVKQNLFSPKVQDEGFEAGAKFWCYFCKEEYLKHDVFEMTTVIGGGLLEHIASEEHKGNMVQFFWDNLLDKKLKPKFILSAEDLHISKKAAFLAVKKYQKVKDVERKQLAETIQQREWQRRQQVQQSQSESSPSATKLSDLPGYRRGACEQQPAAVRRQTLWAQGPGLTSIKKLSTDEDNNAEGNVHTGATPPWMKPDTSSNSKGQIGPTMADYEKHLERERKAKLPSTRVGAGFDHQTATGADWLPSFGRVWNKGRRLQSKIHFEKEWKGRQPQKSHTVTSTSVFTPGTSRQADTPTPSATQNCESGHPPWSSQTSRSESSGPVSPYKKMVKLATETQSSMEGHDFETCIPVVPYKRRKDTQPNAARQTQLLQTPLLAERDFRL